MLRNPLKYHWSLRVLDVLAATDWLKPFLAAVSLAEVGFWGSPPPILWWHTVPDKKKKIGTSSITLTRICLAIFWEIRQIRDKLKMIEVGYNIDHGILCNDHSQAWLEVKQAGLGQRRAQSCSGFVQVSSVKNRRVLLKPRCRKVVLVYFGIGQTW